jgi:hypothetical protein
MPGQDNYNSIPKGFDRTMIEEKNIKNLPAAIHARLLKHAKQARRDLNAVLLQYFQERFLNRISISLYHEKFILKGALLFLIYEISPLRPTKDMDFLGFFSTENTEIIGPIIRDICQIDCNDGVHFNAENISIEEITKENKYNGFRIKLDAYLGSIHKVLQLDIGVGDVIIPGPVKKDFPTLLKTPSFTILVYSQESMIAEKFEAIVRLNFLTSRMKDFYDIVFLAEKNNFQSSLLLKALKSTFSNRYTPLENRKIIFHSNFKDEKEKQIQWFAFLKRHHLKYNNTFRFVVGQIESFIDPLFAFNEINKELVWQPNLWKWK